MTELFFAGIGSQQTPLPFLALMPAAARLSAACWINLARPERAERIHAFVTT